MNTIVTIDQDRLAKVTKLYQGLHNPGSDEMCIMEAVAFVTHKEWSDHPPCVCAVLGAFMRKWNDDLCDDERTALLLPFIPRLINTRRSKEVEQRRATMAVDWLIRTHTVAWLRLAKLDKQADLLALLPEITDFAQCPSLMPALTAVRNDAAAARDATLSAAALSTAAWDAAWTAALAAALAAAWTAARAAARDAARTATGDAARDAALAAALSAARDASGGAALGAARDALAQTRAELQQSAVKLVERMIAAETSL